MPRTRLTPADVKQMLMAVADRVIASEPLLSDADRNLGDGDHGVGMQRGMTEARNKLGSMADTDGIDKLFGAVGMAMISSMGGASGIIFGTLFRDGGKALAGRESFDAAALAAFLKGACDGVMARGKAKPGDKTMVDALHPAATRAQEVANQSLAEAFSAVATAAASGAEASKGMIATLGRAKSLGERSLGHPDAGALSVTVIVEAMRDFVER
jgi:dihydroxyacetone kinase-like protein